MELYLKGTGIISGAGSSTLPGFLREQQPVLNGRRLCVEPDYTGIIPPMQLRRMSKVVRIGIAAAKQCMQDAGIDKPDAISIGTAMGCLQDTEVFLTKMTEQDEQMLTPTAFIQSTHNTVSGQIALLAGCYGHNLTFVQRGHSFEHALINTQLYLNDNPGEKVLTGGIDELTDNSVKAFTIGGVYSDAVAAGEGAAFFIATNKSVGTYSLCIKDVHCFTTHNNAEALQQVDDFVQRNNIDTNNIDLILSGNNGDAATVFYDALSAGMFKDIPQAMFKGLCGEYATASSFAIGMLHHYVAGGTLPDSIFTGTQPKQLKNIIMVNHFKHYYTCWYIQMV